MFINKEQSKGHSIWNPAVMALTLSGYTANKGMIYNINNHLANQTKTQRMDLQGRSTMWKSREHLMLLPSANIWHLLACGEPLWNSADSLEDMAVSALRDSQVALSLRLQVEDLWTRTDWEDWKFPCFHVCRCHVRQTRSIRRILSLLRGNEHFVKRIDSALKFIAKTKFLFGNFICEESPVYSRKWVFVAYLCN